MSINTQMKALIAKSKEGKLLPEEYAVFPFYMNPYEQSGSMTVSNLGMYKIPSFSAIINPPQVSFYFCFHYQSCILAIGGVMKVENKSIEDETKFVVKNMIQLSLSCDHRVMDGVMGANFINTVKKQELN